MSLKKVKKKFVQFTYTLHDIILYSSTHTKVQKLHDSCM